MAKVEQRPVECEKCGSKKFWDNRRDKKSEKSPDFRCKDQDCREPYFLLPGSPDILTNAAPRESNGGTGSARPATRPSSVSWGAMARTYARCVKLARAAWPEAEAQAQVAAAATLFIEANKEGLTVAKDVKAAAVAPAPEPRRERAPEPRPEREPAAAGARNGRSSGGLVDRSFDDFPEALEDDDDDLPF